MARPTRIGLDYYPMDVGFLRDKKVRLLRSEFGASSVLFVLYVLGKVYEGDGYFLAWDKEELLLAADELRESPAYISEVLQGCLSRSLFDERVFQMFGVLTSAGIQRRYLRGCEKRDDIEIINEYWLLNIKDKKDVPAGIRAKLAFVSVSGGNNEVDSPENSVNSLGNPQSKGKESKVKESKVKESSAGEPRLSVRGEYGWVKLTDEQYEKLVSDLGETEALACIAYVDESAQQTGNKNRWKDWDVTVRKCHRYGWHREKPGSRPKAIAPMPAAGHAQTAANNDWLRQEVEKFHRMMENLKEEAAGNGDEQPLAAREGEKAGDGAGAAVRGASHRADRPASVCGGVHELPAQ